MDKYAKNYCRTEEKMSKEQFLRNIELILRDEMVAKFKDNGERITVTFLNGQTFEIRVEDIT